MIGDYTYMANDNWEISTKKVLIAVFIFVTLVGVGSVTVYAIKIPQYQDQINKTIEEEAKVNYQLAKKNIKVGDYRYHEFIPPTTTIKYHLTVKKDNTAELSIEGQQINTIIQAHLVRVGDEQQLIFDAYLLSDEIVNNRLVAGDVVFSLRRRSSSKYSITWNMLKPIYRGTDVSAEFVPNT